MTDVIENPDIISINESVGYRVFRKRKEQGYSGQQVADRLGISQQQLSRYERGRSQINVGLLVRIAEVLQTPVGWFFADYSGVFTYRDGISMKSDILTAECMTDGRKYKF
ncbi:helix-turn-helix transcriptional regulator [Morganella psychrotolerans]|uniref:Helix-turn-helix transcriptional regulator n=1 Tax=Morganella psychrotolerans TaxID=368603 RepID=A0A5M9R4L0_9GAMM|nr:helix-turn-helix transcriptional regulator [Morganella psychrotolerans]KAA8715493.1 helix-turn-helix transcriptional regulator [Morganella psychrotolerans]OBU05533.1 MrfJ protein [Morganella psychrotolerans]